MRRGTTNNAIKIVILLAAIQKSQYATAWGVNLNTPPQNVQENQGKALFIHCAMNARIFGTILWPFPTLKHGFSAPYCAYLQTSCILVSKLHNKAQQLYVCWFDVFIYRSLKLYTLPLERHTEKWNEFSLSHIGKIRSHVQRYWLANTHTGHTATTNRIYGYCHQCVNSTHYTCSVVGK